MVKWNKMQSAPHDKAVLIAFETGDMCVAAFCRLRQDQAVYGWLVYSQGKNVVVASHPVAWSLLPVYQPAAQKSAAKKTRKR